jgi:hypothetical protein
MAFNGRNEEPRQANVADVAPGGQGMTYMRWHVDGVKMAIRPDRDLRIG